MRSWRSAVSTQHQTPVRNESIDRCPVDRFTEERPAAWLSAVPPRQGSPHTTRAPRPQRAFPATPVAHGNGKWTAVEAPGLAQGTPTTHQYHPVPGPTSCGLRPDDWIVRHPAALSAALGVRTAVVDGGFCGFFCQRHIWWSTGC